MRLYERDDAGPDAASDASQGDSDSRDVLTEADPEGGCDNGHYAPSGVCVPDVYVDSLNGDDSSEGTRERPLKTFGMAIASAHELQFINFEPGVYVLTGTIGRIPDGVTLRTRPNAVGTATFDGGGLQSLTFARDVTLENVDLVRFASPLIASAGQQRLTRVKVSRASGAITLLASAELICDSCRFEAERLNEPVLIKVSGTARAELKHSQLVANTDQSCYPSPSRLVELVDGASLLLDDVQATGNFDTAVYSSSSGTLDIRASTFGPGCRESSVERRRETELGDAVVNIEDCEFAGGVTLSGPVSHVRVRRSEFQAALMLLAFPSGGVYDLGLPAADGGADPGENLLRKLVVIGSDDVVFASGNTWNANEQGADAQGRYPEGRVITLQTAELLDGANFYAYSVEGTVQVVF